MGIQNDGYKIYTLLLEYSTATGQPTGRMKPNLPSDPNYIGPVLDLANCPAGSIDPTMNIDAVFVFGIEAEFKILYGAAELVRDTTGVWTVPERTYDNIIFNIIALSGGSTYIMKVTYNDGVTVEVQASGVGQMLFPGPFPKISRIELISVDIVGAFSDAFSEAYNI